MRRYWRERRPASMFRGAELPRLMTGLVMLAVLYMLIVRAADPKTWGWLAKVDGQNQTAPDANAAAAPSKAEEPSPPTEPAPTGPTDEESEQQEAAREEFQAITDGSLRLGPEEMEAYDRLVEWVKNQSFATLERRAKKGLWYTDLYDSPDEHRGQLVALDLEIRRANSVGESRYGVKLWEAWGLTEESRGRLYDVIVLDYPKEMPLGFNIYTKAKFAGYFLKLQGYESGGSKPGQSPDRAPMLIGRLQWQPMAVAAPPVDAREEWLWGGGLLALVGLVFLVRWLYYKRARKSRCSEVPSVLGRSPEGEAVPIDRWLEEGGWLTGEEEDDAEEPGWASGGGHGFRRAVRRKPKSGGAHEEDPGLDEGS